MRLEGASTPGATVRVVDDSSTVVRDDGGWDLEVDLDPGWNDLVIEASDRAGGTARLSLSLYSEPPLSLIGSVVERRDDSQLWADGEPTGLFVENRTGHFAHSPGEHALVRSTPEPPADALRDGFDGYAMYLGYTDMANGDPYRSYVVVDAIGVHVRPGDGFVAYLGAPKYAGQPVRFGWTDGRLAPLEFLAGGSTLNLTIPLATEGIGRLVTGLRGLDLSTSNLPELPVEAESVFYVPERASGWSTVRSRRRSRIGSAASSSSGPRQAIGALTRIRLCRTRPAGAGWVRERASRSSG